MLPVGVCCAVVSVPCSLWSPAWKGLTSKAVVFVVFCQLCFMLVCVVLSCLFLVALWSPAGKGLTYWLSCLLCFVTFTNMVWSTSEVRVRLAP